MDFYGSCPLNPASYFEYCKAIRSGEIPGDESNAQHLAHLDLYERAERGDFDDWLTRSVGVWRLAFYAARYGRCDIVEKYAPLSSDSGAWNYYVSTFYACSLYPILPLVMPLPIRMNDVIAYLCSGLHREVAVHIVGRTDRKTGKTITLESIALELCKTTMAPQRFLDLEEVGLDLDNPKLLYTVLGWNDNPPRSIATLLRERCTKLDELMPNGKRLRKMLPRWLRVGVSP